MLSFKERVIEVNALIITCKSCHSMFRLDSSLVKPTGTKVRCSKCQEVFTVYPADQSDRRKHKRIKTRNLISYLSYDKIGQLIYQGLGQALDISKGGMLLETPDPLESGLISLTAMDVDNNPIEIEGNVVYRKESSSGRYLTGIFFIGTEEQVEIFVTELIKQYKNQKEEI
jgi:predicted Zn finger-like uncharacterized protein